jgi:doxX family protein
VVLGYRARIAAFVMFLNGLAILYLAYNKKLIALTEHGGWAPELPVLFFLGALALFFTGAGKYSLSHRNTWD